MNKEGIKKEFRGLKLRQEADIISYNQAYEAGELAENKRCVAMARSYTREGSSFPDGEAIAQIIEGSSEVIFNQQKE